MSYTLRKEEEEEEADGGEILGGTGYGRWGRVFLFSKSTPSCDTNTTQNCCPFLYRSNATKSEVTRFLNVPLDVSDVFLMTFMILLDSYMEPTRVGSDRDPICFWYCQPLFASLSASRTVTLAYENVYAYTYFSNDYVMHFFAIRHERSPFNKSRPSLT